MKVFASASAALLLSTAVASAGGISRADQSISALFEEGNYMEFSIGRVMPSIDGKDVAPAALGGPYSTGSVADDYTSLGFAIKRQFNEQLSAALIIDQPWGADVRYPTTAEGGSPLLGGTQARVDSVVYTALLRYKMANDIGVHGGLRASRADADVTLNGLAYGGIAGYNVDLDSDIGYGWVAGVSWERPDIAARVALTYNSPVDHDFATTESLNGGPFAIPLPDGSFLGPQSTTTVTTPRSWNLDFQTGVAADTLVFGSVRWVNWSEFRVDPVAFTAATGSGLVDLEDSTTFTLGVGRKFSDTWSGAASYTFEKKGDDLVSPLAPTNGRQGITLAAIYNSGGMKVTTGINYTKLGDAKPETDDEPRALMTDNDALGVGVKVGFSF